MQNTDNSTRNTELDEYHDNTAARDSRGGRELEQFWEELCDMATD